MLDIDGIQDEVSTHLGWSNEMKDDLHKIKIKDRLESEPKEVATYEDGG